MSHRLSRALTGGAILAFLCVSTSALAAPNCTAEVRTNRQALRICERERDRVPRMGDPLWGKDLSKEGRIEAVRLKGEHQAWVLGFGCADEHLHFNHARLRCQSIATEEVTCIKLDEERRRLAARIVFYSHASYVAREYMEPIQTGVSQLTEQLAKARGTKCPTTKSSLDSQAYRHEIILCPERVAKAKADLPPKIERAETTLSHLTKAAKEVEDQRDSFNEQMNRVLAESRKRSCHPESEF